MKLYVKPGGDFSSILLKFQNVGKEDVYIVKSTSNPFKKSKLYIYNMNQVEMIRLEDNSRLTKTKLDIFQEETQIGFIESNEKLMESFFTISWGDTQWKYHTKGNKGELSCNDQRIATLTKSEDSKLLSQEFVLDIVNEQDKIKILAVLAGVTYIAKINGLTLLSILNLYMGGMRTNLSC